MARDDGNDDKIFELIKKGKYIYDDNFQGVSQEGTFLVRQQNSEKFDWFFVGNGPK